MGFSSGVRRMLNILTKWSSNEWCQLFRNLKLLNFDDLYKLFLSRYIYCQVNMILPVSLIKHYGLNADIHGYNTRQNYDFVRHTVVLYQWLILFYQQVLTYGTAYLQIPAIVALWLPSIHTFNASMKRYLLSDYYLIKPENEHLRSRACIAMQSIITCMYSLAA